MVSDAGCKMGRRGGGELAAFKHFDFDGFWGGAFREQAVIGWRIQFPFGEADVPAWLVWEVGESQLVAAREFVFDADPQIAGHPWLFEVETFASSPADEFPAGDGGGSDVHEQLGGEVTGEQFSDGRAEAELFVHAVGEFFNRAGGQRHEGVMIQEGMHHAELTAVERNFPGVGAGLLDGEELVGSFNGDGEWTLFQFDAEAAVGIDGMLGGHADGFRLTEGFLNREGEGAGGGFDFGVGGGGGRGQSEEQCEKFLSHEWMRHGMRRFRDCVHEKCGFCVWWWLTGWAGAGLDFGWSGINSG